MKKAPRHLQEQADEARKELNEIEVLIERIDRWAKEHDEWLLKQHASLTKAQVRAAKVTVARCNMLLKHYESTGADDDMD